MSLFDPAIAAASFGLLLPAELPDKTFVATLVLATRFRAVPVWIGVAAAFAVQTTIAVTAGGLFAQLPRTPVLAVTAALFAIGAVLLARHPPEPAAEGDDPTAATSTPRMAITSFAVLFAAEWGDLSQLLTAGLAARYDDPVSVGVGAWIALALIGGFAVVAGRRLLRLIPVRAMRLTAALLFAALAVLTAIEAAGTDLPFG